MLLKRVMNGLKKEEAISLQFKMVINASPTGKQLEVTIKNMVALPIATRVELVAVGPTQFTKWVLHIFILAKISTHYYCNGISG